MAIKLAFKQTEAGLIPEDWKCSCLVNLCERISVGLATSVTKYYRQQGVPIIRNMNIKEGYFDGSDLLFLCPDFAKRNRSKAAKAKDVITVHTGSNIGLTCVLPDRFDGCQTFTTLITTPKPKVLDPKFLTYHINSHAGKREVSRLQVGGGKGNLNTSDLKRYQLPYPDVHEQEAIASALSDADAYIESLEQLIAKKCLIKKGVMQELLTGKRRLPGFSGEWREWDIGSIADPKVQWSFTGGPFGSNLKSSDYTEEGVRIIQLQNIGDGEFKAESAVFTSDQKADELLSCNIFPGEIILSKMGDPVARACIIPASEDRYLMCSDGIRLCVDKSRFDSDFIFYQINAPKFRKKAESAGTGSTRKRIGLSELRRLTVSCPPLKEQTEISQIISDLDKDLNSVMGKLSKARLIKQGMMQELLTGRIRLV